MNKLKLVLPLLVLSFAALTMTGCAPEEKRTAEECMAEFASAVNSESWGDIKDCTHSDADLHNLAPDSLWETFFGIGSGDLTYSVSGNTATGTKDGVDFTFTLEEDGADYFAIIEIESEGETIFY